MSGFTGLMLSAVIPESKLIEKKINKSSQNTTVTTRHCKMYILCFYYIYIFYNIAYF